MTEVLEEQDSTHIVHFDVEGKFVADLARTRVSEGAWEHGLRILTDSFQGMSHEQAVSLLKGESDLTGWASDEAGIEVVELGADSDLAKGMRERLDWLYGNVFKHEGKYWKPYARVTGWGRSDYTFATTFRGTHHVLDTTMRSNSSRHRPELVCRSLYYAQDPYRDLLLVVQLNSVEQAEILCARTEMPPLWHDVPSRDIGEYMALRIQNKKLRVEQEGYLFREGREPECTGNPTEQLGVEVDVVDDVDQKAEEPVAQTAPSAEPVTAADSQDGIRQALEQVRVFKETNALVLQFSAEVAAATTPEQLSELSRRFDRRMEELDRALRGGVGEFNETRYRLLDEAEAQRLNALGERVREQARTQGGFFKLKLFGKDRKPYAKQPTIEVPMNPFIRWALRGFAYEAFGKERPQWSVVSGSGLKMPNDDPYHTDWMLGAGLDIDKTYSDEDDTGELTLEAIVKRSSFDERARLVDEWTGVPFVVLAKGTGTYFFGEVVHALPNKAVPHGSVAIAATAGPEFQLAMESAHKPGEFGSTGVLICETGGKLAHLATVGREMGCTVLMVPGALARYRPGTRLSIDMKEGTLKLHL